MLVLFLTSSPFHKMHLNDMYIREISEVFDTQIWDISHLYGRGKENSEFSDVPCIASLQELEGKLDNINGQIVVITNVLIYDLHKIHKIFKCRRIPLVSIDKESIIFWMKDNYLKEHLQYASADERKKFFWKANVITRKIYSYLEYRHVKFNYLLGAKNYFPDATKHFVHIHNLKYDEYLRSKEEERVVEYKYILFMDAGLAHLPAVSGKTNSIDKAEYLEKMNHLFERLEAKYHIPVIIAAHPKSGYPEDAFKGRKIILYKTPALLKYAEFVLAHYSTSLIDLVLQKKPVIFLYSESYMNSPSKTILITTAEYAKLLNAPLIDIQGEEDIELAFDENAYDKFITEHIYNKLYSDKKNSELIVDFLNKLQQKNSIINHMGRRQ